MNLKSLALASVLALSAAAGYAQTDASPPTAEAMEAAMTTAKGFAERAASSNQFEIQSSQLAMEKTQTPEVRTFAEQMVADHTAAGEKMMAAAKASGIEAPTALMPDHQALLDSLGGTAADSFDNAYVQAQLAAHQEAVALFEGYSQRGEEGELKTFATETLPTLQAHLAALQPATTTP